MIIMLINGHPTSGISGIMPIQIMASTNGGISGTAMTIMSSLLIGRRTPSQFRHLTLVTLQVHLVHLLTYLITLILTLLSVNQGLHHLLVSQRHQVHRVFVPLRASRQNTRELFPWNVNLQAGKLLLTRCHLQASPVTRPNLLQLSEPCK